MKSIFCVIALLVAIEARDLTSLYRVAMENPDMEGGDMMFGPNQRKEITNEWYRWPNRVVPYVIDSSASHLTRTIEQAAQYYNDYTCLTFKKRSNENDYIRVFSGQGCWSYVGCQRNKQDLSLGSGCEPLGTAIHEFGHAIGFHHEHQRSDRDDHINIYWQNIGTGWEYAFTKVNANENLLLTSYDTDSNMHYGEYSFSKQHGTLPTMRAKNGAKLLEPFDKPWMTHNDISGVQKMYHC